MDTSSMGLTQSEQLRILAENIQQSSISISQLKEEIGKVIVGQHELIDRLLIALLSDGHVLLEGVPGLAKTLSIKTLAETISASFSRIQFTPDLLPADLTGTLIYQQKKDDFIVRRGPVFANFVLADEINRAPAKVQAALLEAMQERQVTIGDETHQLPRPFLVLATQNPIDQEGTYPLPEAQVDRFMLKVVLSYPNKEEEKQILRYQLEKNESSDVNKIFSLDDLNHLKKLVKEVYMDEKIEQYIIDIIFATRFPEQYQLQHIKEYISFGCSPRASINLALAAKAFAFLNKRAFVIPEDIRMIAKDVMRHRIGISFEGEAENITSDYLIDQILNRVEVP